nr:S-layer homology domain-containing protein [Paenibacillus taihuensis]
MRRGLPVMKRLPLISFLLSTLMATQVFAAGSDVSGGSGVASSPSIQSVAAGSGYGGHWAANALNKWSKAGYFNILSNPVTDPNKPITRAEWAALLVNCSATRIAGLRITKMWPKTRGTTDSSSWSRQPTFLPDTTVIFAPNDPVNREEAAVSLLRTLSLAGKTSDHAQSYRDYREMSNWIKNAIGVSRDRPICSCEICTCSTASGRLCCRERCRSSTLS